MLQQNKIYCGDCCDLLSQVDPETIDMTLFSPPYDDIRTYDGFVIDLSKLGKLAYSASKDGAVCAVVINDSTANFAKSLTTCRLTLDWVDNAGWKLFETCIYSRHGRPGAWWNSRFRVDHEYILIFFKGKRPKYFSKDHLKEPAKYKDARWHGTQRQSDGTLVRVADAPASEVKHRGTIWHYSTSNTEGNALKMEHPGTFPDALAKDLILCFTQEGDLVLDPTVGSGTTAVIAKQNGRNYIGFDISQKYVDLANQRLELEQTIFERF